MISDYASNMILGSMVGKTNNINLANPSYLALSSTEPQADGTGVTEPSGNGYERKQLGHYQGGSFNIMGDPSGGVITNAQEIHFNEATGSWGTLVYACIYNAEENGQLIAWGKLGENTGSGWQDKSISPTANTVVVIKEGNLKISIT